MQIQFGVSTDVGRVRNNNEDSYITGKNYAIVADGMGGHKKGEVASKMAVEIISEKLESGYSVVEAIECANKDIYDKAASDEFHGMGTTVVLCKLEDVLTFANVGDSRAYLYKNGALKQITKDHSYVQKLIDEGKITEEEARTHSEKSLILRAVGTSESVKVDVFELEAEENDVILLCSDGLCGCVEQKKIENILENKNNIQQKADELVELANKNGGMDNVTVVLLKLC